jgi:hypothetical protein
MLAALVGIILGFLVALGPLRWVQAPIANAADSATALVTETLTPLLGKVPFLASSPKLHTTLVALVALMAPGLVALAVAVAAKAAGALRAVLAAAAAVVSLASFTVLPAGQSLPLVVIAALLVVSAVIPAVWLVQVGLWSVVGMLAVDHLLAIWQGSDQAVTDAVGTFLVLTEMFDVTVWRTIASVVAAAPFLAAVWSGLNKP